VGRKIFSPTLNVDVLIAGPPAGLIATNPDGKVSLHLIRWSRVLDPCSRVRHVPHKQRLLRVKAFNAALQSSKALFGVCYLQFTVPSI
jgi:hypothetical protein